MTSGCILYVQTISAINEIETAVRAMKLGAYHYITRTPIRPVALARPQRQRAAGSESPGADAVGAGRRPDRARVRHRAEQDDARHVDLVHKIAKLSATVLILGESGTGKELLARLIHREAGDAEAPFIAVNLAAIPRELAESALFGHERGSFTGAHRQQLGKFELATNGTLFLDEIGDLGWICRRSCCARSRRAKSSGSAAASRSRPNSG